SVVLTGSPNHREDWGSKASRRPSPMKLTHITVIRMARPGKYSRWALAVPTYPSASASMRPHEVVGGCTPNPRNDSVDSVMMAAAMASVAFTRMGPMVFGIRWRVMMRLCEAPDARAASTYSFSLIDRIWLRTTRAMYIHPRPARIRMIVVALLPNFLMAMARMAMAGTTRNRSVTRIRTWSVHSLK